MTSPLHYFKSLKLLRTLQIYSYAADGDITIDAAGKENIMDITQMETPELIEILKEIPTSLLLRMTYERVVDINIRTESDDVAMHCENIAEEIHEVVVYFDAEEAKQLRAYQNHMFDAGFKHDYKGETNE